MDTMEVIKKIGKVLEFKVRDDITEEEIDSIIKKIQDLQGLVEENEQFRAKLQELEAEVKRLKVIEQEITEKEAEQAVKEGIEAGIIPSALFEVYKKRYKENKEEFKIEMDVRRKAMQEKIKTEKKVENLSEYNEMDELKSLMLKAGIDITNEQSVKNFIEFYNKRRTK